MDNLNEFTALEHETDAQKQGGIKGCQAAILMLLSAVLSVGICLVILVSGKFGYKLIDTSGEYDASLISYMLEEIDSYYYYSEDKPDNSELIVAAAKQIVAELGDPYSAYFTEEDYSGYRDNLNGNYKGIGIVVSLDGEGRGLYVQRAYANNPAYEAGIRDGDIITAVNGASLAGLDLDTASDMLKGEDGSIAHITLIRGGEALEFNVARGDVTVSRVFSMQLEDGVGYICIEEFTGDAAEAFDAQLQALLDSGITSLIIDLRNNPGGSLDTVVHIADRVLGECVITTLEGKTYRTPEVYSSDAESRLDIPFAVLVNENSASASEVFSAAIQDNEAAPLIGTNTFGKGIVQTSWSLGADLGYIKLTTDVYRTPNGRMIHEIGLAPDIEAQLPAELQGVSPYILINQHFAEDTQLAAAIEYLSANQSPLPAD